MALLMDETVRQIRDFAQRHTGHIRLGCVPGLAVHLLLSIAEKLRGEAKDLTLQLVVAMSHVLLAGVREGDLDLAIGPLPQANEDFESGVIVEDEVIVLASRRHPIFQPPVRMEALLDYRWVLPAATARRRQWLEQTFSRCGLPGPTVQTTSTA